MSCERRLADHRRLPLTESSFAQKHQQSLSAPPMARTQHLALLLTAATALKPTRRLFFSNAAGAACGVALPALADSGVPMDLGPLGLRNGGSGKLNSCPPQGIKRACIGTSKFDTPVPRRRCVELKSRRPPRHRRAYLTPRRTTTCRPGRTSPRNRTVRGAML